MSRAGKLPVAIPSGVTVNVTPNQVVVKGAKSELKTTINGDVNVTVNDGKVWVKPANEGKRARAMWGTVQRNIKGMVEGVTKGFSVRVDIVGVGYRAAVDKGVLSLTLGYSHEIKYAIPQGIDIKVDKQTGIIISGADRQKVGQVSAELIRLRKPEPYKGKGVHREGRYIRRKEGKKK